MSDRPDDRRKKLRLLLIFGSTSSVLALSVAVLAWAWAPGTKTWTLPPQPVVEDAAPKIDNRWSALQMPTAIISGPMKTNKSIGSDETMVMAELGSSFASIGPSAGPEAPPEANYESYTGFGSFNVGGGTGSSWRGTINPNGSGPGALGFPSYFGGGGVGGGGGGSKKSAKVVDKCEGPDAASIPECQTASTTPPTTPPGEGGSCVITTSVINGVPVVTKSGDCDDDEDDDQSSGGDSCASTTSNLSMGGVSNTSTQGNCNTDEEDEDDDTADDGGDNNNGCYGWSVELTGPGSGHSGQSECANLPVDPSPSTDPCLTCSNLPPNNSSPGNDTVAVPEPGSLALVLTGLAGLLALRRRRR